MKLENVLLAEYAGYDGSKKLNILGVFKSIVLETVPGWKQRFYLVLFFSPSKQEIGAVHNVKFRFEDPSGTLAAPDTEIQTLPVPKPAYEDGNVFGNIIIEVNGFVFHHHGMHHVIVEVDGREAGKYDFSIRPTDKLLEE